MEIKELMKEAYATAHEKGWHDQPRSFGDFCANVHGEVSEAFESYRTRGKVNDIYHREDGKPEGVAVELADVLIRIAEYCEEAGVPLEEGIAEKLAFNKTREYRHGNKAV